MRIGNRRATEYDMTLAAREGRVGFALLNLHVERAAVVCGRSNVAASARDDRHHERTRIERVHGLYFVTDRTACVRVHAAFVAERAGRVSPAPLH